MSKNRKLKILKRSVLILSIVGLLLLHFFAPRLITDIRNPIVGLIKRNKPLKVELASDTATNILRKDILITSFDKTKLSALFTYSAVDTT